MEPDPNVNETATPASQEPVAPENSPSFDPVAFERDMKAIDPEFSLTTAASRMRKLHRTASEQGRKLSEMERESARFKPLAEAMQDPNFNAHMRESLEAFYGQQNVQPDTRGMLSGFDPVDQRLKSTELELRTLKIENDLERLEARGFNIKDPDRREQLADKMISSPGLSARDAYMILFGEEDIRLKSEEAARSAAAAIRDNNNKYTPVGSRGAPPKAPPKDVRGMSEAEYKVYAPERTQQILDAMRNPT